MTFPEKKTHKPIARFFLRPFILFAQNMGCCCCCRVGVYVLCRYAWGVLYLGPPTSPSVYAISFFLLAHCRNFAKSMGLHTRVRNLCPSQAYPCADHAGALYCITRRYIIFGNLFSFFVCQVAFVWTEKCHIVGKRQKKSYHYFNFGGRSR